MDQSDSHIDSIPTTPIISLDDVKEAYLVYDPEHAQRLAGSDWEAITDRLQALTHFLWDVAQKELTAQHSANPSKTASEADSDHF